jgi:hypothetical protein
MATKITLHQALVLILFAAMTLAATKPVTAPTISDKQKASFQKFLNVCINDLYNLRIEKYRQCIHKHDQLDTLNLYKEVLKQGKRIKELKALQNKSVGEGFNLMTRQVVEPMVKALRGKKTKLVMSTEVLTTQHVDKGVYLALVEVAMLSEQGKKIEPHHQPFYFSVQNNKFILRTRHEPQQPHKH